MGSITGFLILAGLFISVSSSKVGGSFGHVKNRDIDVPKYAKHVKLNLRKQHDSSNVEEDANNPLDDDTQPTFDNPPEEEALAKADQLNEETQTDYREQPQNALVEGNLDDPDKENLQPPEENTDIADSPDKLDEEDGTLATRGIEAGDTFTPHELLPVTRKLIEKVESPGEGKGIVSSSKSPEALADVLFESFFFGPQRIVTLEDKDIIGLDALQALALSGDEVRRMPTKVTAPGYLLNIEDQIVKINNSPRASKYLLLRKPRSPEISRRNKKKIYKFRNRKDKRYIKRRAPNTSRQNLIKKLQKKRKLVLNPVRKNNKINKTRDYKGPAVSKIKKEAKSVVNTARENIKYNKTKAIKLSASTKTNKDIKRTVNSARKNVKINKATVTKTAAVAKVNKGVKSVKETHSPKVTQKNKKLQKLSFAKKGTDATYVPGKPNKGNKHKSVMLNRIKGNPATPRPSSGTTVHRTSPLCRWRYECSYPGDLDTCKLHTQCNLGNLKATTSTDFIGPVKADEEMRNLRRLSKMIGISPVDEEVEKILEARMMQFRPLVMVEKPARIESLSQYFNNIIVAQLKSTTMAESYNNYDETTKVNLGDQDSEKIKDGVRDGANDVHNERTMVIVDSDYRRQIRNLGVPHTGKPFLKKMY